MDNQWKDLFENAEHAPSGRVWEGIEANLSSGGNNGTAQGGATSNGQQLEFDL